MSNSQRNDQVVKNALERLSRDKDVIIEDGMQRILSDAMNYAISIHDYEHFGHRTTDNSYGWCLLHNGEIKHIFVNDGRHGEGEAGMQLRDAASSINKSGWVGIILASMTVTNEKGRPIYFEIDYEMGVLDMTIDEIKDNFNVYFKPINA